MARDRDTDSRSKGGVSLRTADAEPAGGLFGPGPATIVSARWEEFEYKKKGQSRGTIAPVLLVKYERDGEEHETPYGVGSGWRIENKGLTLTPKNSQKGLPEGCNTLHFLESLENADPNPMPKDYLETPDQLDGIEVVLINKPIERTFERDGKSETQKKSLLVVSEVISAPWVEDGGKGKSGKASSSKKRDDDDEDEKPRSSKSSGKGKQDEEDLDEKAVEALNDLLADEDEIAIADIEKVLRKRLKSEDNGDEIAARASEDDLLDLEKGWERKGKKIVKD